MSCPGSVAASPCALSPSSLVTSRNPRPLSDRPSRPRRCPLHACRHGGRCPRETSRWCRDRTDQRCTRGPLSRSQGHKPCLTFTLRVWECPKQRNASSQFGSSKERSCEVGDPGLKGRRRHRRRDVTLTPEEERASERVGGRTSTNRGGVPVNACPVCPSVSTGVHPSIHDHQLAFTTLIRQETTTSIFRSSHLTPPIVVRISRPPFCVASVPDIVSQNSQEGLQRHLD